MSDTHGWLPSQLPLADVLLHAGDFTRAGDEGDARRFASWFRAQPHKWKFCTLGNHELEHAVIRRPTGWWRKLLGPSLLLDKKATFGNGNTIYGTPWVTTKSLTTSGAEPRNLQNKFRNIPDGLTILMSHSPPEGILDNSVYGNAGSRYLLHRIRRVRPYLNIFGHVHRCGGRLKLKSLPYTTFVNSATMVMEIEMNPPQKPHIISAYKFTSREFARAEWFKLGKEFVGKIVPGLPLPSLVD